MLKLFKYLCYGIMGLGGLIFLFSDLLNNFLFNGDAYIIALNKINQLSDLIYDPNYLSATILASILVVGLIIFIVEAFRLALSGKVIHSITLVTVMISFYIARFIVGFKLMSLVEMTSSRTSVDLNGFSSSLPFLTVMFGFVVFAFLTSVVGLGWFWVIALVKGFKKKAIKKYKENVYVPKGMFKDLESEMLSVETSLSK